MGEAVSVDASRGPGCFCGAPELHSRTKVPPAIVDIPCCFGSQLRVSPPQHAFAPINDRSMIHARRDLRPAWTPRSCRGAYGGFDKTVFAPGDVDDTAKRPNAAQHRQPPGVRHGLYMIVEEAADQRCSLSAPSSPRRPRSCERPRGSAVLRSSSDPPSPLDTRQRRIIEVVPRSLFVGAVDIEKADSPRSDSDVDAAEPKYEELPLDNSDDNLREPKYEELPLGDSEDNFREPEYEELPLGDSEDDFRNVVDVAGTTILHSGKLPSGFDVVEDIGCIETGDHEIRSVADEAHLGEGTKVATGPVSAGDLGSDISTVCPSETSDHTSPAMSMHKVN